MGPLPFGPFGELLLSLVAVGGGLNLGRSSSRKGVPGEEASTAKDLGFHGDSKHPDALKPEEPAPATG